MAGEIWQTSNTLKASFFQTVRQLKRSAQHIVFNTSPYLAFPSSDVTNIRQSADLYPQRVDFLRGVEEQAAGLNRQDCRFEWRALCASPKGECTGSTRVMYNRYMRMASDEDNKVENGVAKGISFLCTVSFMGFTGQGGILPYFYTEKLLNCLQKKDERLKFFLDLFDDRLIQLFYESWESSRFDVKFERYRRIDLRIPTLSFLQSLNPFPSMEIFYTGILSKLCLSAAMLEQILSDYFQLPIHIYQNIPIYLIRPAEKLTRITSCLNKPVYNKLGKDAVMGRQILYVNDRFMIQIGPIDYDKFVKLLYPQRADFLRGVEERAAGVYSRYMSAARDEDSKVENGVANGIPTNSVLYAICDKVYRTIGRRYSFFIKLLINADSIHFCQLKKEEKFFLGWNVFLYSKKYSNNCLQAAYLILRSVNIYAVDR